MFDLVFSDIYASIQSNASKAGVGLEGLGWKLAYSTGSAEALFGKGMIILTRRVPFPAEIIEPDTNIKLNSIARIWVGNGANSETNMFFRPSQLQASADRFTVSFSFVLIEEEWSPAIRDELHQWKAEQGLKVIGGGGSATADSELISYNSIFYGVPTLWDLEGNSPRPFAEDAFEREVDRVDQVIKFKREAPSPY